MSAPNLFLLQQSFLLLLLPALLLAELLHPLPFLPLLQFGLEGANRRTREMMKVSVAEAISIGCHLSLSLPGLFLLQLLLFFGSNFHCWLDVLLPLFILILLHHHLLVLLC